MLGYGGQCGKVMRSQLSADSDLSHFEVKKYYIVILKVGCSQSENKVIMSF